MAFMYRAWPRTKGIFSSRQAAVGEPVPGEHALTGDGQPVAEVRDSAEEGVGAGGDGLMQDDGSGSVEDAQGHRDRVLAWRSTPQ
jgi:hypothetical protein